MAHCFAKIFYLLIKAAFFYPSDLVNNKTTIPLRVGEERWICTSTLCVSVYIHHYSPLLWGIIVYYCAEVIIIAMLMHTFKNSTYMRPLNGNVSPSSNN